MIPQCSPNEKIPANHNIISIHTLPQKKEFILKFQGNQNICTTEIH